MDYLEIAAFVLTFLIGLVLKSPYYQRSKKILGEIKKALEDDKLTAEEIQLIINAYTGK